MLLEEVLLFALVLLVFFSSSIICRIDMDMCAIVESTSRFFVCVLIKGNSTLSGEDEGLMKYFTVIATITVILSVLSIEGKTLFCISAIRKRAINALNRVVLSSTVDRTVKHRGIYDE